MRHGYGDNGIKFNNDIYYKDVIAKAIIFKFIEKMVSQAKDTWYGGDFRAQIVTYTISKLVALVEKEALNINLNQIWSKQAVTKAMGEQLELIAKTVSTQITQPPVANMNVGEWCKKEECWKKLLEIAIPLTSSFKEELAHSDNQRAASESGRLDFNLDVVVQVVTLSASGCWSQLQTWATRYSPLFGKDADLVRNAANPRWVPSTAQAKVLLKILKNKELEGFASGG